MTKTQDFHFGRLDLDLLLVLLDGLFHIYTYFDPVVLETHSPDWVISRTLFGTRGFSPRFHLIMGIFLVVSVLWTLYHGARKLRPDTYSYFFRRYMVPIVLLILDAGVMIGIVQRYYME